MASTVHDHHISGIKVWVYSKTMLCKKKSCFASGLKYEIFLVKKFCWTTRGERKVSFQSWPIRCFFLKQCVILNRWYQIQTWSNKHFYFFFASCFFFQTSKTLLFSNRLKFSWLFKNTSFVSFSFVYSACNNTQKVTCVMLSWCSFYKNSAAKFQQN